RMDVAAVDDDQVLGPPDHVEAALDHRAEGAGAQPVGALVVGERARERLGGFLRALPATQISPIWPGLASPPVSSSTITTRCPAAGRPQSTRTVVPSPASGGRTSPCSSPGVEAV